MPEPRVLLATGGALFCGGVLVTTALVPALDEPSREITSLNEGRLPLVVLLGVFALAALAPLGVVAWANDSLAAAGLTLSATAVLLPLWASWPQLEAHWRAWALAFGPLAVGGLALMARSYLGAGVAAGAALLHAVAYDPFRDVGCARICLEIPAVVPMPTSRLTLAIALALLVAAGLTLASAWRRRRQFVSAGVGALALAGVAVARWLAVGDAEVYADLLLLAVPVPGLVAWRALVGWMRTARRRAAAQRLARHLSEGPASLLELGASVDLSLLSPGQRLALQNARLAADTRARLVEVQASQRRVVAAADAERQRIERDLHDGTQQRLVGVLMQLSGRGLEEVEQQIREVLADLRSFSHGTFPPVLDEEGLAVALTELAATSDADLRLDLLLDGPVPPEQGRAIYALISRLARGTVDVSVGSGTSGLEVTLVGCQSADLVDVGDRVGALGGTLTVVAGRIEGRLPCGWGWPTT